MNAISHISPANSGSSSRLAFSIRRWLRRYPSLPRPGSGNTLQRWRVLSEIAASDLASAKVLEAHYDATAILEDAGRPIACDDRVWAVWAAEGPDSTLRLVPSSMALSGNKPWCSGARMVTHALVTVRVGETSQLAEVALSATSATIDTSAWHGPGMADIETGTVCFTEAPATLIGSPNFYLDRPGFWHGGAGVAACWYGAATAVAERLRHSGHRGNPFAAAHLGAIDAQLTSLKAHFRAMAASIDSQPDDPHRHEVLQLRTRADRTCRDVLERCALAMGPGPLCTDEEHARRCADLNVFIRQSHAERDEQWLGEHITSQEHNSWQL